MAPTVALLGTGIMGAPMGRAMVAAGLDVRAWNRTRAKAEGIDGAVIADSPADALAAADVAVTMLADGDSVLDVMRGAIGTAAPGLAWAQMSTIGIEATALCRQLAEQHGIAFVDAPVLGTKRPAEAGELLVLASGPGDAIDRCAVVFDAIGRRTLRVGESDEATRLKLVNNCWLVGVLGALAETIAFAEHVGVDAAGFLDLIDGGPIGPLYARIKGDLMLARTYEPASFPATLAGKDARLIVEAARASGVELSMIDAVARAFERASSAGFADQDMAAVIEAYRG